MTENTRLFPIQTRYDHGRKQAKVAESIYMAAYEVYSHVYAPQQAMIDLEKGCRGGFSLGELTAFLYARSFPKAEWRRRVDEAFNGGLENIT